MEDALNGLDDFVHEFVGDVVVEVVGLALHGVLDAVVDGQQAEEEQQAVVEALLAALLLVFGKLDGGQDPLVDVAPIGAAPHVQRNHLLHFGIMHALPRLLALCDVLEVVPGLEVGLDVWLHARHIEAPPVLDEDHQAVLLLALSILDALVEYLENLLV